MLSEDSTQYIRSVTELVRYRHLGPGETSYHFRSDIFTEIKYINILGIAGTLSFLSEALQYKIGTIFIGRTSGEDVSQKLSSLFLGQAVVACTGYVVVTGIVAGMGTLCSQAFGAKDYKLVGTYFNRALVIAYITCIPILAIWISVKPFILLIYKEDIQLAVGASDYTTILCFSYPAYLYTKLACSFLQAQNKIVATLIFLIFGNFMNIFLQLIFVVVVPLEIKGVAISYVISTNIVAVLLFGYMRLTNISKEYFNSCSFELFTGWLHFLKYGIPGVLQKMIDLASSRIIPIFYLEFMLKNNEQLALLGIFNTVWFISISLSLGYGSGVNVRIGNLLGANDPEGAKRASIVSISFGLIVVIASGLLVFSFASYISFLFTSEEDLRQQIEFGIKLLGFVILSDIVYIIRGIFNACCLQNIETFTRLIVSVVIAGPLGCVFASHVSWKAAGYYLIMCFGLLCTTIINLLILYSYSWKNIAKHVLSNVESRKEVLLPKDAQ